jgi:hypothetical protein
MRRNPYLTIMTGDTDPPDERAASERAPSDHRLNLAYRLVEACKQEDRREIGLHNAFCLHAADRCFQISLDAECDLKVFGEAKGQLVETHGFFERLNPYVPPRFHPAYLALYRRAFDVDRFPEWELRGWRSGLGYLSVALLSQVSVLTWLSFAVARCKYGDEFWDKELPHMVRLRQVFCI